MCPKTSVSVAPAIPHAVKACASREPPTSRVISASSGMDAAAQTQRADPQRHDAVAEQRDQPLRQQRDERRLIRIAPRRRQHPEVQLVAVVPVERREHRQHDHEGQRRRDDVTDGERMPHHGRVRRGEGHGHRISAAWEPSSARCVPVRGSLCAHRESRFCGLTTGTLRQDIDFHIVTTESRTHRRN